MNYFLQTLNKNRFLFSELVKRDFKQKYKRTVLGMGWSILSPLLTLLVMRLVFTQFFGRNMPHYTTYLFAGNPIFSYFREATTGGMNALMGNAHIFTKINVPKYIKVHVPADEERVSHYQFRLDAAGVFPVCGD